MTMADQFKAKRKPDYRDAHEFLDLITEVDPQALAVKLGESVVIKFSDKSEYTMEM